MIKPRTAEVSAAWITVYYRRREFLKLSENFEPVRIALRYVNSPEIVLKFERRKMKKRKVEYMALTEVDISHVIINVSWL